MAPGITDEHNRAFVFELLIVLVVDNTDVCGGIRLF